MISNDMLISQGGVIRRVGKNVVIFQEGLSATHLFSVVEGRIKLVSQDDEGREFLHEILAPGDIFGSYALDKTHHYLATAIADIESVVVKIEIDNFDKMLSTHPKLLLNFTRILTERLHYKYFISKELALHTPELSLCNLLQFFRVKIKNVCPTCGKLLLTRQQIANMLGLRVETVIRLMKILESKQVVTIRGGKVFLSGWETKM
ncbi:MAG TPA: Crp/Fnr family transcriptional regulator [Saprospiraceae bacterium]|nr:Crp/Fnr family transcriptional regulator [Saprospiraceae bacterium]HQW55315.1 Crp/Fnr family transcriptional regulator [Saprospiraceae bacterium]